MNALQSPFLAALLVLSPLAACSAGAAPADDVATLNKTRTIELEAAPVCDSGAASFASGAARSLRVGADALSLRIEFQLGTATLSQGAAAQLDRLAATLSAPALAGAHFMVAGHTDARGSDAINTPLSCDRAKAVRAYLEQKGIDPARLQAEGFGARLPLTGTPPLDGANRRVEVRRLGLKKETP